jgi:hypothetical protein
MKQLVTHDGDFGIALTAAAATAFTAELRGRLQAALSALQATPARPLPPLPPVRVALDGESVLELTTREALDLYFAFMELVDEGASGAAEHIHVYDADDRDEFPVWIDPGSSSRASLAD